MGARDAREDSEKSTDDGVVGCAQSTPAPDSEPSVRRPPTESTSQQQTVDGGILCWIQVIGSFAVWSNTWGLANAFGEFQTYFENILPQSASEIAWIGSIQSFLLLVTGILTGSLFDAGYFRSLLISGNFLVVLGMMLTSICSQYWQVMICQGVVTGIGFGCLFTPGVSVVSQYFVKKRQFANGVAAVGSGFGGVIYPIVLHRLAPRIGFHWAIRVVAFITIFFGIVAILCLRNRRSPDPMRSPVSRSLFRDTPLVLYSVGLFFILIALYIPIVYISSYSLTYSITDSNLAFYLVPILQAANIIGRLVPNFFADWTGPINMTIPALLGASIMVFVWTAIRSEAGLLVFAVIYGVFFGTIQALGPPCVASLTDDLKSLGSRTGMSFGMASFGVLIGTPIAGAALGRNNDFVALQVFTGSMCVLATCLYVACRVVKTGFEWTKI